MWQNSLYMIKAAWTSGERGVIVLCAVTAFLSVASNLVNLYISPAILSAVERHVSISELVLTILGFTFAVMALSALSAYVNENVLFGRISVRTEILSRLNRKAATTSYPNIDDEGFKKLLEKSSECVSSNREATEAIWETLTSLLTNFVGFIIYVSLLSTVEPVLIVVILLTTVSGYFISKYLNGYGYRHRDEEAEYERHMSYVSDRGNDLPAAKEIRIFGLRPWLSELYRKAEDAYTSFHRRAEGVYIWARIADLLLTFLRSGAAYAYLIALVLSGGLGVSEFLLYFTAVSGFTEWVSGILGNIGTLHKQSLDICTVRECLEYPEPFKFDGGEHIAPEPGRKYEIKLENVSYRYPGAEADTLRNINLTLYPGEKLAVVGLNGAGKTTLVKLFCGFLDPTEGRVTLDGRDIREFDRAEYYTMFSAVFQNFMVLASTVAANIAGSEDDIDIDRVRDCAERAGLKKKIESLPDGYDTYLNREVYEDAATLSGGETQRLMLARALYKNAPFVVLDEPTAALDPLAESDMYHKYNEMTAGKSSVYISHRLASTRFCDRIILIEGGKIAEEGTHDELLKLSGRYAELFEVQSKYYREDGGENEEK